MEHGIRSLRILVVDDHEVLRRGVRSLLEGEPSWTVVGEASDGFEAVQAARELKPDIVVLDIGMPRLNGLEAAQCIQKVLPTTKILILTIYDTDELAHSVLESGAQGYLTKNDSSHDLISAVRALQMGKLFFTSHVQRIVLNSFAHHGDGTKVPYQTGSPLTSREREIVQLIAEGKTNKQVCATLNLGAKAIETHRARIMKKLAIRTVSELVLYAVRNHIVQT